MSQISKTLAGLSTALRNQSSYAVVVGSSPPRHADPKTCKFKKEKYFQSEKVGHIKIASRTLAANVNPVKTLQCSDDESSSSDLNHLSTAEKRGNPISLEGTPFRMEIDTGADVTYGGG